MRKVSYCVEGAFEKFLSPGNHRVILWKELGRF
jgi:hypothetical protein